LSRQFTNAKPVDGTSHSNPSGVLTEAIWCMETSAIIIKV